MERDVRAALAPLVDLLAASAIRAKVTRHRGEFNAAPWSLECRSFTRDIPARWIVELLRATLGAGLFVAETRPLWCQARDERGLRVRFAVNEPLPVRQHVSEPHPAAAARGGGPRASASVAGGRG